MRGAGWKFKCMEVKLVEGKGQTCRQVGLITGPQVRNLVCKIYLAHEVGLEVGGIKAGFHLFQALKGDKGVEMAIDTNDVGARLGHPDSALGSGHAMHVALCKYSCGYTKLEYVYTKELNKTLATIPGVPLRFWSKQGKEKDAWQGFKPGKGFLESV